jgi:hypothetical protein
MKGNAVSRIALFSSIIFNTCLLKDSSVSSGSMDRYLKKTRDNFEHEFAKFGPAVCVLGKTGIGKTWTVHNALDPCIELTAEILSSKQSTLSFLDKIRGTDIPVILDEYETVQDLVGLRELTGTPTNGLFVVVSQVPVKFDFEIHTYHFPVPSEEDIRRIVPGVSDEVLKKCRGDVRYAIQSLTIQSDEKDEFQGARDFIESLVLKTSNVNPVDYIGHSVHEPGNITAILHENYPDSRMCRPAEIMESLSEAMIFESKIYTGNWDLYPYYNFLGCVQPAVQIGHALRPPLRPGSVWTKHQSACARAKRLEALAQRVPGKRLSMDEILLLHTYAQKGDVAVLKEHGLTTQDLDVLNHLSPTRKIKPKDLAALKKSLV